MAAAGRPVVSRGVQFGMDVNPYAPPQSPPELPQRSPPVVRRPWYENPLHPATLAIVGAILGALAAGIAIALVA